MTENELVEIADRLESLSKHEGWDDLVRIVQNKIDNINKSQSTGPITTLVDVNYRNGQLDGLRSLLTIVPSITKKAREVTE